VRTRARLLRFLALVFTAAVIVGSFVRAQTSETPSNIRRAESVSPTPTPRPKSKSARKKSRTHKKATPTPTGTPRKSPSPSPKASPHKAKAAGKKKSPTPAGRKKKKSSPPEKSPSPRKTSSPRQSQAPEVRAAIPVPASATPLPTSTITLSPPVEEPAEVTIEKSGYAEHRSFFARLFGFGRERGGGGSYRYLTRSVRAAIDRAPVARARWQFIVVHNSGTRQGNAAAFDYYHRYIRRMRNGLAYHFVIGNGTSTGNGEIEVGDRWRRQINGGHVHSDYLNNISLGICLVGDFNRDQPTRAQLDCCEELIRYLRQRCGKIDNHYALVKPHREMNPPRWPTDCPGDAFPYSWFRRF
jgi:N-acetylmuramoyl-L-alanine amidase